MEWDGMGNKKIFGPVAGQCLMIALSFGKTFGTSANDDHFPHMLLGLIDMSHRYFPVTFMYPSLEQNDGYTHFLKSIVKLCRTFGFAFNLK